MKLLCTAIAAVAMAGGIVANSTPASARMADPRLKVSSASEQVACRTVRERVHRPSGAIVWRTKRICAPRYAWNRPRCFTERQRIVRPNGAVVYKKVRRCR